MPTTPRRRSTLAIWATSLLSLVVAGLLALAFATMATSLDPEQMITAGAEPWTDAALAVLAFVGLLAATGVSLRLWHSARFRLIGLLMTALEAGLVAWACLRVYAEYF